MSRLILQNIIQNFDPEDFIRFFRGKSRVFAPRSGKLEYYDDEDFTSGQRLGEITFPRSGERFMVCAFETAKSLSERSGKKAQYEKAKKILKETQTDVGIFIFYDDKGNFRFSLVYANYLGKRRDWSNFRRFTYFVSQKFTNKTFLQRIGDGDFSTLEKIKDAFSVEKVTKEFYKDIANWYFWAVRHCRFPKDAESEQNGRNIAVIRLITRLIFIWFMRERGLVSYVFFDQEKISKLLKDLSSEESTYYKAVLQNLFFATLNTTIKGRKFRFKITGWKNSSYLDHSMYRYESYFVKQEDMLTLFKDIPFLNGGLFDCLDSRIQENGKNIEIRMDGFTDKDVGLQVPNFLFFSKEKRTDLNEEYGTKNKKYNVRGLINILSTYNFTIDENDPNDQEVALDPELLGKVFENLLANFNPETSSTARKATGSYYTPRAIVDYMVRQSLMGYFKTHLDDIEKLDEKLRTLFFQEDGKNPFDKKETARVVTLINNLRIVDPAVGSGAFPMGVLNKLVSILSKLDPENQLWREAQIKAVEEGITDPIIKKKLKDQIMEQFADKNFNYGRKLYLIQKCIYGVDIQQIAVEIAKLRFFISLLVDEKIDKSKDNWDIEPLPNLDFKIMQGNSLISEFMGIDLDVDEDDNPGEFQFEDEVSSLIKVFQQKKGEFQNESDKKKRKKLKEEVGDLISEMFEVKLEKQKADYSKQLQRIEEKYSALPNEEQRKEIVDREKQALYKKAGFNLEKAKKQFREFTGGQKIKPFFAWKLYFAEVFQGKDSGFDIVIANPPYNARLSKEEREFLKNRYKSVKTGRQDTAAAFVELAKRIGNGKMEFAYILPYRLFSRKRNHGQFQVYTLNNFSIRNVIYLGANIGFTANDEFMILIMTSIFSKSNLLKVAFKPKLNDLDSDQIFSKLEQSFLIERGEVNLNSAKFNQLLLLKIEENAMPLNTICHVKDGIIPYIREKLVSGRKVDDRYIKFAGIAGTYILQKYNFSYNELYLCYDMDEAKKYIKNKEELRKVQLRRREIFLHRKIITAQNSITLKGAIDENQVFVSNSLHSTYLREEFKDRFALEYILALINSKLLDYYHDSLRLKATDLHPQILVSDLRRIPIKRTSYAEQRPFITLVYQILAKKKQNPEAGTSELEAQMDELVFDLYELTSEEREIVLKNAKKS